MAEKLDRKSEGEVAKLETYAHLRKSDDWAEIRALLFEEINDLQSVMNVEGKTAEEIAAQVGARRAAVELIVSVIQKIEGSQTILNALIPKPKADPSDYIVNEDEE